MHFAEIGGKFIIFFDIGEYSICIIGLRGMDATAQRMIHGG